MNALLKWLLLGMLLATFIDVTTPLATAQAPVTLSVYNPTGGYEITQTFAPRLADLNGKTICEVTDANWEYARTFPLIQQLLLKQFPTMKIVTYDKFPILNNGDEADLVNAVKKEGCQAAIVGNAG